MSSGFSLLFLKPEADLRINRYTENCLIWKNKANIFLLLSTFIHICSSCYFGSIKSYLMVAANEKDLIFLDRNENQYGPSPECFKVLQNSNDDTLTFIPEISPEELKVYYQRG